MSLSQRDRLNMALAELRATPGFEPQQLDGDERRRYTERVADHKWTRKNFVRLRTTLPVHWKGDELTMLHELSYYLLPRALWAERREGGGAWVRREQVFTLVALVQHQFGREIATALKRLLTKNGVKYRARRMLSAQTKMELVRRSPFKKKKPEPASKPIAIVRVPAARVPVHAVVGRRRIRLDD